MITGLKIPFSSPQSPLAPSRAPAEFGDAAGLEDSFEDAPMGALGFEAAAQNGPMGALTQASVSQRQFKGFMRRLSNMPGGS